MLEDDNRPAISYNPDGSINWHARCIDPLVPCHICGGQHPQLYIAWRKPCGAFGAWTVFRYLGEEHVPDLSIPIAVNRVPRGADKLSPRNNSETWHK